jgi:hypothetical protein
VRLVFGSCNRQQVVAVALDADRRALSASVAGYFVALGLEVADTIGKKKPCCA